MTKYIVGLLAAFALATVASAAVPAEKVFTAKNGNVTFKHEVHKALDCTKCHDPHTVTASCTAAGCHPDVLKPGNNIPRHDAAHASVTCSACHDASGLKVGPTDGMKNWVTYRPTAPGGKTGDTPYVSHSLQRTVDCARCHAADNPWGLPVR